MNKRIRELADQVAGEFELMYTDVPKDFYDKFAELIVRDCACVPTDMWGQGQLPAEWAGRVQRRILAHFGVA